MLSRSPDRGATCPPTAKARQWDAKSGDAWFELVNASTVIVNLAGQNLFNWRWTKKHKARVVESRIGSAGGGGRDPPLPGGRHGSSSRPARWGTTATGATRS